MGGKYISNPLLNSPKKERILRSIQFIQQFDNDQNTQRLLFQKVQKDFNEQAYQLAVAQRKIEALLSDRSSHLRCWRLRSADQLTTGLVLSGAPGPHLQEQTASRLRLHRATHNTRE
jgi:hypothetical protein